MSYQTDINLDALVDQLPKPVGYKLLLAIARKAEKVGNILLPENTVDRESTASIVGLVLKMGPDAYLDTAKFPNGPYCEEGDWVSFRAYSGTRFKIAGAGDQEFRMINDDQVEAVLPDPTLLERV